MKITLVSIGKTDQDYLKEGLSIYQKRLKHYVNFEIRELASLKKTSGMPVDTLKQKEAEVLRKSLEKTDFLVLLDEKGTHLTSEEFAGFLQKRMNAGTRELSFVVGGAWGFDASLQQSADYKLALSSMTFSHQMVRLFFCEQLYRAFTIIRGESYHNE